MKRFFKRFFGLMLLFAFVVCLLCPAVAVHTFAAGTSASSGTGGAKREKPAAEEPREEVPAAPEDEALTVAEDAALPEIEMVTEPISVVQTKTTVQAETTVQTKTTVKSNTQRVLSTTPTWRTIGTPTVRTPTAENPTPELPRIVIFDPTPKAPSAWRP